MSADATLALDGVGFRVYGHAILDEAALRAARSLKSLPADAPRQTVLPIRFRLK